ncbi:hypothetical protein K8I31_14135 [bacterium]|nr:hypothetical protein [bacterium]
MNFKVTIISVSISEREIDEENPQEHFNKCLPSTPLTFENGIVIFILKSEVHTRLLSWEGWRNEKDLSQRIVPYVEAGFPEPISLSDIETEIIVTLKFNPNLLSHMLIKARKKSNNR